MPQKLVAKYKDRNAVEALMLVCRDRDGAVKSAAAEALGKIGDPRAIPVLMQTLPRSFENGARNGRNRTHLYRPAFGRSADRMSQG